jgi:hypothetical protein
MQYNNKASLSNHLRRTINTVSRIVVRIATKGVLFIAPVALAVPLSACSDSLTSSDPDTTFATASKPYAKALTPEAKQAVISAMEQERNLRQKAAAADRPKGQGATEKTQN